MKKAICLLAVVPMRKEPGHRSEMVSQLLFGEYVLVREENDDFTMVEALYDGYAGWVQTKQLTPITDSEVYSTTEYTCSITTKVLRNGTSLIPPYGTPVYGLDKYSLTVGGNEIKYLVAAQQLWDSATFAPTPQNLYTVYMPYLNVPYLWGGKSVWGVDCSGFVQQVFKLFGVRLLRDAYLQAEQGVAVETLEDAQCGDLAFFCNEAGRVTHVGLVLEDGKIIHASGRVKIDDLTTEGIVDGDTGKLSHRLYSVRRVII